jgi:FhuF-like iron-sulfur protein
MTGNPRRYDDAALLTGTAELGDYFAIPALGAGKGEELVTLLSDDAMVAAFVDRTRSAIAASTNCHRSLIPLRLAASSFQLNVVSRLISPAVGAAAAFGMVPLLTPTSVRWYTTGHHTPQFGVAGLDWVLAPTPSRAAEVMSRSILATVVGPLADTLRSTASLSTHVSWGNAISAANGAVTVMSMSRPDLEPTGRALVRALLDTGSLTGTGRFAGGQFVRRSCCLFYQAPGGGLCGDCVLAVSDGSQRTDSH